MDNNKSQLIDLWRTSFNDSEEFIKLFFDRVYKKENALFIEKNKKIVFTNDLSTDYSFFHHRALLMVHAQDK